MVIGFSIQYLIACCCCLFSDEKKNKSLYIKENTNMSLLCEMSRERERGHKRGVCGFYQQQQF